MRAEYQPQLATLVKEPPRGQGWLHEVKYDGYRIGCRIASGRVTLWSRKGNDWTRDFPEIAQAAAKLQAKSALIDGEIAVLLPDGRTSFQALQNSIAGERHGELVYFAFDGWSRCASGRARSRGGRRDGWAATRSGWSRACSRKSPSPSGPRAATSAIPRSRDCATTKRRAR